MLSIAVGSSNPAKIKAVSGVISEIWPGANVIGGSVSHNTRPQPLSDEEAIGGAKQRAEMALRSYGADLGIGLEGCTVETAFGLCLTDWIVVIASDGRVGIGGGARLVLPEIIASQVRRGAELGAVIDDVFEERNAKSGKGAIGILTNHLIDRSQALRIDLICSLARFIRPELYRPQV